MPSGHVRNLQDDVHPRSETWLQSSLATPPVREMTDEVSTTGFQLLIGGYLPLWFGFTLVERVLSRRAEPAQARKGVKRKAARRFRAPRTNADFVESIPPASAGQVKSASALKYSCTRLVTTSLGIHSR